MIDEEEQESNSSRLARQTDSQKERELRAEIHSGIFDLEQQMDELFKKLPEEAREIIQEINELGVFRNALVKELWQMDADKDELDEYFEATQTENIEEMKGLFKNATVL